MGRCSAPNANGPPTTPNAHSVDPTSPRRRVRKELGAGVQHRPKSKRPRHQHQKINGHRPPSAFRRKEQSKPIHVAPNHQTGIIPPHLTSTHTFYLKTSERPQNRGNELINGIVDLRLISSSLLSGPKGLSEIRESFYLSRSKTLHPTTPVFLNFYLLMLGFG